MNIIIKYNTICCLIVLLHGESIPDKISPQGSNISNISHGNDSTNKTNIIKEVVDLFNQGDKRNSSTDRSHNLSKLENAKSTVMEKDEPKTVASILSLLPKNGSEDRSGRNVSSAAMEGGGVVTLSDKVSVEKYRTPFSSTLPPRAIIHLENNSQGSLNDSFSNSGYGKKAGSNIVARKGVHDIRIVARKGVSVSQENTDEGSEEENIEKLPYQLYNHTIPPLSHSLMPVTVNTTPSLVTKVNATQKTLVTKVNATPKTLVTNYISGITNEIKDNSTSVKVTFTTVTPIKKNKKPLFTLDVANESPVNMSLQQILNHEKDSSKTDYIIPVVGIILAIPLIIMLVVIIYKKGSEFWERRHYRRMDFLIDGMYND